MKKNEKAKTIILIICVITGFSLWIDIEQKVDISKELNHHVLSLSSTEKNGVGICINGEPRIHITPHNEMQICSDLEQGAIITWTDNRNGHYNIFAQKVNATGHIQWQDDGIALSLYNDSQVKPTICTDGEGGAIIAWMDGRDASTHIYAQRIDRNGNLMWNPSGVLLADTIYYSQYPKICSDGNGGAIITWDNGYTGDGIYVQYVNSTGHLKWGSNGVHICTNGVYTAICSDGDGGAIIAWNDFRDEETTGRDIYAQKVNISGEIQWTNNGVGICVFIGQQYIPMICSDSMGGAIIAYRDYISDVTGYDIRMQGVNSSGSVKWRNDGVPICVDSGDQVSPQICSDSAGGAYITWSGTYAQHVNSTGWAQWSFGGIYIMTGGQPKICNDGFGGAIITAQYSFNIIAQQIDTYGNFGWNENGTGICTAENYQEFPELCSDGAGGAIICYFDSVNSDVDIYAQRVNSTGDLLWLKTVKKTEVAIPGFNLYIISYIFLLSLVVILRKNKGNMHLKKV